MKSVEVNGRMAEDGSIILPPGVLETIGVQPGNLVHLVCRKAELVGRYDDLPADKRNKAEEEETELETEEDTAGEEETELETEEDVAGEEDAAELVIPHDLLKAAHIPLDAGLVVQMVPGAILIGDEDPMDAVQGPLLEILSLFGISEEEVNQAIEEGGYYDE